MPKKMIWIEKFFTRLPIAKNFKVQISVRLFFLFGVWLTGLAAYALDGQATQYLSNLQILTGLFGVGLIILMGTFMIQESLGDTVLSVRPLLNMDDYKFKKLLGRIEWYSYSFIPYLLLTLVLLVLPENVTLALRTLFEGFHGFWTVCFVVFSGLLSATGIWICVSIWLTTYLISRQPIQVELSSETMKKFRGLVILGLWFAAFYFLAVSFGVVLPFSQTPVHSLTDVIMSPLLPFTVFGLVGVLLPFYNIHRTLLSLKNQELSKIQSEFEHLETTLDEILTKPNDQLSDQKAGAITLRILSLQVRERRIRAAQEWPIDIGFISKLMGLGLVPVAARYLPEILSRLSS